MESTNVPIAAAERKLPQRGKLFVGGVPARTTEDELREHFARFGRVAVVAVPKHKSTGKPRGFAFVQFMLPEDAERALAMGRDGHVVNGWKLDVKVAEPKAAEEDHLDDQDQLPSNCHSSRKKNKIFVGGLPTSVDGDQLKDYFRKFGPITRAIVVTDKNTNISRGFGFVEFAWESHAQNVLKNNMHCLDGVWVEVKDALPKGGNSERQGMPTTSSGLSADANPYHQEVQDTYFITNGYVMVPTIGNPC